MYGVDSLRQLAMKFLERDELATYTFQNDFLRPFVVIMRHSKAVEIRELIIRWVGWMRVGWTFGRWVQGMNCSRGDLAGWNALHCCEATCAHWGKAYSFNVRKEL
jgi:hypothetical protein